MLSPEDKSTPEKIFRVSLKFRDVVTTAFRIWRLNTLKLLLGYAARRSAGLRINLDGLGIFNVRRNSTYGSFHMTSHQKNGLPSRV